ncbi:MAG: hypothetical protein HXX15_14200 [Rhodopseudomonas sp.]|uniref:hypothetical protein n=1 Tax=Rhodopseudomonas sp. TaxID=1078 RepID=UPI0017CA2DE2|nr:hypothetical protein [Rhodopseudomonas sp.]NVN87227.1 hypothetical protein [Rhodopseudomonas sp.]
MCVLRYLHRSIGGVALSRWQRLKAEFGTAEFIDELTEIERKLKPPLPTGTVQRVVDLALEPPAGETTHWTGRMLAKAAGVQLIARKVA